MTALDEIVDVQISVESATIDRAGFGTALIAGYHNYWPELSREFGSLEELTDAGMPATDAIYAAATRLLSQEFKPPTFKVGKLVTIPVDQIDLQVVNVEEGFVYDFDIGLDDGTQTNINYTNGAGETVDSVGAALQALIDAVSGIDCVDNTGGSLSVTVTAPTAGASVIHLSGYDGSALEIDATSAAQANLATELSAIESADSNWYGLLLAMNRDTPVEDAAAWVQARTKFFCADLIGTDVANGGVGNLGLTLQSNTYSRTFPLFDADSTMGHGGAAMMGDRFPTTPGSSTWKFKDLAGVTVDTISAGQRTNLRNQDVNFYTRIAGVNIIQEGVMASGQFADIIRGIDWLQAEVQTNVFALLASQEKVPFTDSGVDAVRNQILAAINQGIANDLLAASPAPTVTAPRVANVSLVDKSNRLLPDIEFTATLAGAIHKAKVIRGKVTV